MTEKPDNIRAIPTDKSAHDREKQRQDDRAKVARCKELYDTAIELGFSPEQALYLCHRI